MQSDLARSSIGIDIAKNKAQGVQAEADGESYRLEKVGRASAVKTEADGLAIAKGLEAQQQAIGKDQTAHRSTPCARWPTARSASCRRTWRSRVGGDGGLGGEPQRAGAADDAPLAAARASIGAGSAARDHGSEREG